MAFNRFLGYLNQRDKHGTALKVEFYAKSKPFQLDCAASEHRCRYPIALPEYLATILPCLPLTLALTPVIQLSISFANKPWLLSTTCSPQAWAASALGAA